MFTFWDIVREMQPLQVPPDVLDVGTSFSELSDAPTRSFSTLVDMFVE